MKIKSRHTQPHLTGGLLNLVEGILLWWVLLTQNGSMKRGIQSGPCAVKEQCACSSQPSGSPMLNPEQQKKSRSSGGHLCWSWKCQTCQCAAVGGQDTEGFAASCIRLYNAHMVPDADERKLVVRRRTCVTIQSIIYITFSKRTADLELHRLPDWAFVKSSSSQRLSLKGLINRAKQDSQRHRTSLCEMKRATFPLLLPNFTPNLLLLCDRDNHIETAKPRKTI